MERKEHELALAQQELNQLRSGNQVLDATKFNQEKSITE